MTPWALASLASLALLLTTSSSLDWPQWGGPGRNFVVDARDLAMNWPADGPPRK